jgi:serine/threonine-protein kinase SRPK3
MAVFDQDDYEGLIQPVPYRAPEEILGVKWKSSADIWNLGVLVYRLFPAQFNL